MSITMSRSMVAGALSIAWPYPSVSAVPVIPVGQQFTCTPMPYDGNDTGVPIVAEMRSSAC
jgi:hypothetical protein